MSGYFQIGDKDTESKNIKKENDKSSTAEEYFNLPENKDKIITAKAHLGYWSFEYSGTKLSFNKDSNENKMIIESYTYIDSREKFPGNRLYFMNNGSVFRVSFSKDGKVNFTFVTTDYGFTLILNDNKWDQI
jgi:hypothetical protein